MKSMALTTIFTISIIFVYAGAMAAEGGQEIFGMIVSVIGLLGFVALIFSFNLTERK